MEKFRDIDIDRWMNGWEDVDRGMVVYVDGWKDGLMDGRVEG